ncbi:hypothetical protein OG920_33225 [Streptomyces europaeiscabiei]|uniref:hypothetical protein n=1 Tax=Streptomyces europaeiscabiei TaxID=146819 RepID=UPI0030DEA3BF
MPHNSSDPREANTGGHQENFDISLTTFDGKPALVVQPTIPDSAQPAVKNGLAVRRAANATGTCPDCGARLQMPNRKERRALTRAGKVIPALFLHEAGCTCMTDDEGR